MRIRLRPYHPSWVIGWLGVGGMEGGYNKRGFDYVMDRIRKSPDVEVELVEGFDDICLRCDRLTPDDRGSVWGEGHTCTSAQDPAVVAAVRATNGKVLEALELDFGSVVRFRRLASLLRERVPDLGAPGLEEAGGGEFHDQYRKGLEVVARLGE